MLFGMDVHKKTLNIDHSRLKKVRRLLGAPTDTSAIHMALDWVLESQEIVDDIMAVAGKGAGRFRSGASAKKGS
jgi:hypothetical protein